MFWETNNIKKHENITSSWIIVYSKNRKKTAKIALFEEFLMIRTGQTLRSTHILLKIISDKYAIQGRVELGEISFINIFYAKWTNSIK